MRGWSLVRSIRWLLGLQIAGFVLYCLVCSLLTFDCNEYHDCTPYIRDQVATVTRVYLISEIGVASVCALLIALWMWQRFRVAH